MNKINKVNKTIKKLKKITKNKIEKEQYNTALAAISLAGDILYEFNQYYTDDDLEKDLSVIADKIKEKNHLAEFDKDQLTNTILVYDGFGLDSRGVISMYLNALGMNGYKIVYAVNSALQSNISSLAFICQKYHISIEYIDIRSSYVSWLLQIVSLFESIKPKCAFFYTTPNDTSAAVAFHIYEGLITRYQIDLTDHAFWLGKCAFDYCLGSREMSAYIEHFERRIPKEKLIKLGVNLLIPECENHEGLPFDIETKKYIFSGGALYKTLGDPQNTFYKIVDHILSNHKDVYYLYAGGGDETQMRLLINKYPDRAFLIDERKDFYYLIQHCIFYLNTYPMFGGMMMKYSAYAKKLPITLKHSADSDGLLLNQEKLKIEYSSYEELIEDVDRLLKDNTYLKYREKMLENSVITEERFVNNLKDVIECQKTDYNHQYKIYDTTTFRKEYYDRYDHKKTMQKNIKRINKCLIWFFPTCFVKGILKNKVKKIMKEGK